MAVEPIASPIYRYGFHYFPDTQHYTSKDLTTWLPVMNALGGRWATLLAPATRAIPEEFIVSLIQSGIDPILHLPLGLGQDFSLGIFRTLMRSYRRWGVRYITLFDQPNSRRAWPAWLWTQQELVERFLDFYLPLAEIIIQEGLLPVFPPLEPGGDYWDLSFLRAALRSLLRRKKDRLLAELVLGAYGWARNLPLTWGAGGPESWPNARPYFTPPGSQDQKGFFIFNWYLAIAQAELGFSPKIILLKAGCQPGDHQERKLPLVDSEAHARRNLLLAQMTVTPGETIHSTIQPASIDGDFQASLPQLPFEVLACNFWLLCSSEDSPHASHAWFPPDARPLPVVQAFYQWRAGEKHFSNPSYRENFLADLSTQRIAHYLLLPENLHQAPPGFFSFLYPFIKEHQPRVGFSLEEAQTAERVTVLGGEEHFPKEKLTSLHMAGCQVEQMALNGTLLASSESAR